MKAEDTWAETVGQLRQKVIRQRILIVFLTATCIFSVGFEWAAFSEAKHAVRELTSFKKTHMCSEVPPITVNPAYTPEVTSMKVSSFINRCSMTGTLLNQIVRDDIRAFTRINDLHGNEEQIREVIHSTLTTNLKKEKIVQKMWEDASRE